MADSGPIADASTVRRAVVYYDAECGVCTHTARTLFMLDRGGRLRFSPLQGFIATEPGDPTRDEMRARLHVRDEAGAWHAGGEAILRIAGAIPLLAPLAAVGRLPGMRAFVEAGYEAVARNRQAISSWLGVERCRFDPPA